MGSTRHTKTPAQKLRFGDKYRKFRKRILMRDGWRCTVCMSQEQLTIHHYRPIHRYLEDAFDPGNVVTLCRPCHLLEEHGEIGTQKMERAERGAIYRQQNQAVIQQHWKPLGKW